MIFLIPAIHSMVYSELTFQGGNSAHYQVLFCCSIYQDKQMLPSGILVSGLLLSRLVHKVNWTDIVGRQLVRLSWNVPFWLIFSHVLGWVRILRHAAAISLEFVGSTSRPECRVCIMSTGPPFLVAIVGTP